MGIGMLRRHRAFAEPAVNPNPVPREATLEDALRVERARSAALEAELAALRAPQADPPTKASSTNEPAPEESEPATVLAVEPESTAEATAEPPAEAPAKPSRRR